MNVLKRHRNNRELVTLILFFISSLVTAQVVERDSSLNILFYNTENLFDTEDDASTRDEEFLPRGERHWTYKRYEAKLYNTAKVIIGSCGFEQPAIVGLCEVENREVLEDLLSKTPLSKFGYRIIHKDSPDERGIDVVLIYLPEQVTPIGFKYIQLIDAAGNSLSTREILQADFLLQTLDTLHVFINHWPSRYSGQVETEPLRIIAANTLKAAIDRIRQAESEPKVVIMGDFNDQPSNRSMNSVLMAAETDDVAVFGELINLSSAWQPRGTLKHEQSWQIFDQVIVSDYLLNGSNVGTSFGDASIVSMPFLFEPDLKYGGKKLFRTYLGYKYQGGFSDHLPIRLKLTIHP